MNFPEGGPLPAVHGPDGGPADVGEHQPTNPMAAGGLGHRRHEQVAMLRVAVSGRREQEASFFTVIVWRDQAEHAAQSL